MMDFLVLDTNAIYDLSRRKEISRNMINFAKTRNLRIAVPPIALVECVTKSNEDEPFRINIIKPAFKKLKSLDPIIVVDQDLLLENFSFDGAIDLVNRQKNWEKILNHMHECDKEGPNLVYKVGKDKRFIHAKFIADQRHLWEERYKNDWLIQLKLQGVANANSMTQCDYMAAASRINQAFFNQPMWDDMLVKAMEERTGMDLSKIRMDLLKLIKYQSQEYRTIWNKIITTGYKPFSQSKKNDYNDMSVMLYAGIDNVYVFSGDVKMADKTQARQDGKLFTREDL